MLAHIKMLCLFILTLAVTVLLLALLNWIPSFIQPESIRKYGSLEDVQKALHTVKIYLPAYFPERLQWPPSEIYAQNKPYTLVLMHVKERQRDHIVLGIRQVDARSARAIRLRIEPTRITQQEMIAIKGRPAVLSLASCADGSVCNMVAWREGNYRLTVVARDSARELIRIAESML